MVEGKEVKQKVLMGFAEEDCVFCNGYERHVEKRKTKLNTKDPNTKPSFATKTKDGKSVTSSVSYLVF